MKERKRANIMERFKEQGLTVPTSIRPDRVGEYKFPICNMFKKCNNNMTNACMYCIVNYSTWREGNYMSSEMHMLHKSGPSGKRTPTTTMDHYLKRPEEK